MFFVVKNRSVPIRFVLLADTHGVLDERIAEVVARCDYAVHAGDVGGWAPVEALRPRSGRVFVVRGNNDTPAKWHASQGEQLAALPDQIDVHLPGGRLVAVHGHRYGAVRERHERLRAHFPAARTIVYGHSHRLVCDTDRTPWVLNPGAAGRSRTYGGPSCLVLTIRSGQWHMEVVRFASPAKRPRTNAEESVQ